MKYIVLLIIEEVTKALQKAFEVQLHTERVGFLTSEKYHGNCLSIESPSHHKLPVRTGSIRPQVLTFAH